MCRVWSSDNTTYDLHTDVAEMIVRFDDYVRNKRKVRRRKILRNVYRSVACLLILLTVGGGIMLLKRDKREMETANRIAGSILPGQGKPLFFYRTEKSRYRFVKRFFILPDSRLYGRKRFRDNQIYETTASPDRLSHDRYTDRRRISGEAERRDDGMVKFRFAVENPDGLCGKRKKSFLSGEAYFDVVKNDRKPFIVETDLGNIKVYGTEFNVKRYSADRQLKATLVEGSIGFSNDHVAELKLQPGYQLSLTEGKVNLLWKK